MRLIDLSVPATVNLPLREGEIGLGRLEQMRRDLLAALDHLVGGEHDRRAAARDRARAEGAGAGHDLVGIAVLEFDQIGIDAELVEQNLLECRRMALAVIVRAHQQGQRAGRIEADLGMLEEAGRRRLDRVGDADAAQLAAPP